MDCVHLQYALFPFVTPKGTVCGIAYSIDRFMMSEATRFLPEESGSWPILSKSVVSLFIKYQQAFGIAIVIHCTPRYLQRIHHVMYS